MPTDKPHATPQPADDTEQRRHSLLERLLAYAAVGIMVVAVIAYLITLIVGMAAGSSALEGSLWPIVTWIAFYGLPAGFVLLVVLLVINFSRRGRAR